MFENKQVVFFILAGIIASGCSHTGSLSNRSSSHRSYSHYDRRLGSLPRFDIPVVVNDRVMAWVDFFQGSSRARFERYLERSGRYVSWMRGILREEGVPQDLVFLALIESGFSNHAYSRASAVGPWQFIGSTGDHYGLDRNGWVDERRDPEKATRAAAAYLKKLYRDFGDWYLAMAAYNAGEGRIANAIEASGSRDFWSLSAPGTSYLKAETKDYVPKFLAAALIAKMPHRFGFKNVSYQDPFAADEVHVDGPLDLNVASELAGTNVDEIQSLNPELSKFMTPPHSYRLRVPEGSGENFRLAYANLPAEKRMMLASHKVKRGESIDQIARRYGTTSKAILAANTLKGKKLKSGMVLMIPKKGVPSSYIASADSSDKIHYHRVKRGDRLNIIADKFGVSVASLKKENGLKGNQIVVGQRLKITTPYTVQKEELLAYNSKSSGRTRMNGVEWLIRKEEKNSETDVAANIAPEPATTEPILETTETTIQESDLASVTPPKPIVDIGPKNVIASPSPKKVAASNKTHVIKKGDNLWDLSRKYKVSVNDLKTWNGLSDKGHLKPGKKLVVYRGKTASIKKKKPLPAPADKLEEKVAPGVPPASVTDEGETLQEETGVGLPSTGQSLTQGQSY
ncbi:MAG: hypothetical protein A2W61_02720 [Deltaproteobacteria bacterium RIFCSPLOWO2_01_44_7]|nr:MAG: hypothetical protein A2W61_02720 [Deltaproteobacteria bacterium RIFCSPLOWO2_01_44_7]